VNPAEALSKVPLISPARSGGAGPPPSVCPFPENAPEDEEELDDVACFLRVLSSALQVKQYI